MRRLDQPDRTTQRPASAMALVIATALLSAGSAVGLFAPSALRGLGEHERVADGVELYRLSDGSVLSSPGPIAIQMLRVDLGRARLRLALAQDRVLGTETVADMARRHEATAAINAGFFLPTGEPAGLFKIGGELVSDTKLQRGAVGILPGRFGRRQRLVFDQVSANLQLGIGRDGSSASVPVDGVDTARPPGQLVWFTPRFAPTTETPADGTECVLRGRPLRVAGCQSPAGASPIPPDGAVLSAGNQVRIDPRVKPGTEVRPVFTYRTARGSQPKDWERAPDVVGGVGLLVSHGQAVGDWGREQARAGFTTERHPRTIIGVSRDGRAWLVTIDGRNPALSVGMSFTELQALAARVGLVEALNLDGGGSTTLVAGGRIVNHPSDPTGPRRVSDALLVFASSDAPRR